MIVAPQFLERPVHVDEELINHRKATGIRFIAEVERFQKAVAMMNAGMTHTEPR